MKNYKNTDNEKELSPSEIKNKNKKKLFAILFGAVAGLVCGLFGGGGGMIVVPVLTFLLGKNQKVAHATAILIILPITIVCSALYSYFGNLDITLFIFVGIGCVAGGILGAVILKKSPPVFVQILFAVLMIISGVKLVL